MKSAFGPNPVMVVLYKSGFEITGVGPLPVFESKVQVPVPLAGLVAAITVLVEQVTFWLAPGTEGDGAA